MGKSAEAGVALQKVIELDPTSSTAHDDFAFWQESVGNLTAAEQEYRKSIVLDGNDQIAHRGIARVHQRMAK